MLLFCFYFSFKDYTILKPRKQHGQYLTPFDQSDIFCAFVIKVKLNIFRKQKTDK